MDDKYDTKYWNIYYVLQFQLESSETILINRTNNPLERLNGIINNTIPNAHPSMLQFLKAIQYVAMWYFKEDDNVRNHFAKTPIHQPPTIPDIPEDYLAHVSNQPANRKFRAPKNT